MLRILLPILGVILMALVLLDVFLTVLYARIGTGIISHPLACYVWRFFRWASAALPRGRDKALSFAGPVMLVLLVAVWFLGLMFGATLIIYPWVGTSFSANGHFPEPSFITAMYLAGDSLTTIGASDYAPRTAFFRIFSTFLSLIGLCVLTLTLTYLLEVYNALQRRNTFALKLHLMSGETADAAEMVAGLGPHDHFSPGYTHLAEIGAEMAGFKESHHFYSVLFYFRFKETYYAVSRVLLLCLDSMTLIKSGLRDDKVAWLKESAGVAQIWRASAHLMTLLAESFLPQGMPQEPNGPDPETIERWKQRYFAALARLRQAGIETVADEQLGAENYVALRARWDRYVFAFARHMAHSMENIDPNGANPQRILERQPFPIRLRSTG